jgi:hypothetical protein
MADITIKYKASNAKSNTGNIDIYIRDTINGLNEMQKEIEKSTARLSCAMPCSLFKRKDAAGRQ